MTGRSRVSVFLELLGWVIIAFGAAAVVLTLADWAVAQRSPDRDDLTLAEAWPDMRPFLPCLAIGLSLLGQHRPHGTAGWWLTQAPLFAVITAHLAVWAWSRLRRGVGGLETEREFRGYLLVFAFTASALTASWKSGTAGWWLMLLPLFAAAAVYLEVAVRYVARRKSQAPPAAEPSRVR
jgi:hypothetical protein